MKHVFASLFNDRAISYRVHQVTITVEWRSPPVFSGWCAPTRIFWRDVLH